MSSDAAESSPYGPLRHKVLGKQGPMTLYRPSGMSQDDFSEMMQEVAPQLLQQVLQQDESSKESSDSRGSGIKRECSEVEADHSRAKSQRTESPDRSPPDAALRVAPEGDITFAKDEVAVLSVAHEAGHPTERLSQDETSELINGMHRGHSMEVLLANYIQKKASKEIRGTGN